ncbi:PadR family transcriptional regulator [Paenibacillus daejeonensis]|uniref:PadR family transcriptional regulator n=1 Tax=Paenibacillus daejeonensis TaxID=135193 RepID=UPI00035F1B93|nr:PadR family transcriptional regulator [Paenibacillus daejeonensis]
MTNMIILALLRQKPMHGYEIQQLIQQSRMDLWANLLSGSIYYALNKLEKDGLIVTEAEERTGARLRKIYAITEAGEVHLLELVSDALASPPHSVKSDLVVALNWIETLPKEEALSQLRASLKALETTLSEWQLGRDIKREYGLSAYAEASFDNAIALLELDITFVKRIIAIREADTP